MTEDEQEKIEAVLETIKSDGPWIERPTQWELEFMESQEERIEQYKDRTRFSEKQTAVIGRIYDKIDLR